MTFLYGQTTLGELTGKLVDLIAGATSDDHGVTTELAHRWRTRFGGDDVGATSSIMIAPPALTDRSCTQEHRAGYWLRYDDSCMYNDRAVSTGQQYVRQTSIMTGAWPVQFYDALMVSIRVTTANTTPGDYSTARIQSRATAVQANSSTPQTVQSTTTLTPAADGTVTWTYGSNSITFKIGNSTGTVQTDVFHGRWFTDEFRGGIDVWSNAGRNVDGIVDFSIAPPGVENTDYVVNVGPTSWGNTVFTDTHQYWYSYVQQLTSGGTPAPSALLRQHGLGIKTNNALTGARYEASFTWSDAVGMLATGGGTTSYYWGGASVGTDGARQNYGTDGANGWGIGWLQHGSTSDAQVVQYWISVTDTHLAVVLNADNGTTWRTCSGLITRVETDEPDYACWAVMTPGRYDGWYRLGAHQFVEELQRSSARDGGRDWQTGYGRADVYPLEAYSYWASGEMGNCGNYGMRMLALGNGGTHGNYWRPAFMPYTDRITTPNLVDQRWQLEGFWLMDSEAPASSPGGSSSDNYAHTQGRYRSRGTVNEGFLLTPSSGFVAGDELTDTDTDDRYLLWLASDYTFPGRGSDGTAYQWGFALEEV